MDLLSQIMNNGDLPQWVQHRLNLVVKDLGDEGFDFYLEYLNLDQESFRNNNCIAWFLTEDEIINVVITLQTIQIAKHKLSCLTRVHKSISTSTEDICNDVCVQTVTIEFAEGKKIVLNPPRYCGAGAIESYIKFISRF
ncbi:MAG: hypothetical protein K0R55_1090 [Sporomusa sp.]|nr:hypothetical protein [Sporomusa sp.]